MYRGGKRFDREQLIFVVEAMLCGALDRIESAIPDTISLDEYNQHEDSIKSWVMAAKETAGMSLAVLWAQLNDDGVGIGDALHVLDFDKVVADFVAERTDPKWAGLKKGDKVHPDCRPLAEKFVNVMFEEYLVRVTDIKFDELGQLLGQTEALVFTGCGGKVSEWTEGVKDALKDMVPVVDQWYKLTTTGGRVDLVMPLPDEKLDIGKLAIWRVQFGDCSWWSDYRTNYRDQHKRAQ